MATLVSLMFGGVTLSAKPATVADNSATRRDAYLRGVLAAPRDYARIAGKPETINRAMHIVRYRENLWTQLSRISTAAYKFGWLQGLRK
jgi:hypothetical protein